MKKLFLAIVVAIVTTVMCVSFTACSNAKSIKSEKVSEDQWSAAFQELTDEDVSLTLKYSLMTTEKYSHKTMVNKTNYTAKSTHKVTIIKNGNLEYASGTAKLSFSGDKAAAEKEYGSKAVKKDIEQYSEATSSGIVYVYEKELDGKWAKEAMHSSLIESMVSVVRHMADSYDEFMYSSKHKGYISSDYEEGDTDVTVFKFKDGKLVAIYMYMEETDITNNDENYEKSVVKAVANVTISYGSTKSITLPYVEE